MFLDLVTLIALHFSGWNAIPHFFSHSAKLFRSSCMMLQSFRFLLRLYRMQSSAKSLIMDGHSLEGHL